MQVIPITDAYSQSVKASLGGQSCRIALHTRATGLFCDLYVKDTLIIGGVLCLNRTKIVRDAYLGFQGDLMFLDSQGSQNPSSPGLGSRFVLYYLEAVDL